VFPGMGGDGVQFLSPCRPLHVILVLAQLGCSDRVETRQNYNRPV